MPIECRKGLKRKREKNLNQPNACDYGLVGPKEETRQVIISNQPNACDYGLVEPRREKDGRFALVSR